MASGTKELRKREPELYFGQSLLAKRDAPASESELIESEDTEKRKIPPRKKSLRDDGPDDRFDDENVMYEDEMEETNRRPAPRRPRRGPGGSGRRRRRRPTTSEAPGIAGRIYSALASDSGTTAAPWFGSQETTIQPRRGGRRRRRRRRQTTERPGWFSRLNPYNYIGGEGSAPGKIAEAVDASYLAFKDTLGYGLIPGLQLLPFLAGMDAFAAALVLEDEPSKGSGRRTENEPSAEDDVKAAISHALFPVYPIYDWAKAMIEAGQKGKATKESRNETTTESPFDVTTRSYSFDPASVYSIVEATTRYAQYTMTDASDFLTRVLEQPILALREGLKSAIWNSMKTFLTTGSPQYGVAAGLGRGSLTALLTLFTDNGLQSNVPSIMKLHPFYWLESIVRTLVDPLALTGINSDGIEEVEVFDNDSSTPKTVRVARKYDPSIFIKFTPNYWVYYVWKNGWRSLNPFKDNSLVDLDNEMVEDDGGGTNIVVKLNPIYSLYTILRSTIKVAFGWGGKDPAEDNFYIDSWFKLIISWWNPYSWLYADYQFAKSFAKALFDPLGISMYWDRGGNPDDPDNKYRFVLKMNPGYWLYYMYNRLADPFGNTIKDPKLNDNRNIRYEGIWKYLPEYTLTIRPYYLIRILWWPLIRFIFDPARLYTTDYIPENLDFIIAPVLEVLSRVKSKVQPTSTLATVIIDDDLDDYYPEEYEEY